MRISIWERNWIIINLKGDSTVIFLLNQPYFFPFWDDKIGSFWINSSPKDRLAVLKRPVLVKGPLGIVSMIEMLFLVMFIALLVWSIYTYLRTGFQGIEDKAAKKGEKLWEPFKKLYPLIVKSSYLMSLTMGLLINWCVFLQVGVQAGCCSSEASAYWEHSPCISVLSGGSWVVDIATYWPHFRG